MAIIIQDIIIPEKKSECSEWISYYKKLDAKFGAENAKTIWLKTWQANGSTASCTTRPDFNAFFKKHDIDVTNMATAAVASVADLGGSLMGLGKGITKMLVYGVPIVLTVVIGAVVYSVVRVARNATPSDVASLTPQGRGGFTVKMIQLAKQNPKAVIITSAVVIAGIWGSVALIQYRQRERDRKAVAFFSELQRDIAPDSVGLVESNAFNIRYWEETAKKLKKPLVMLTSASASAFAKDIKSAWGVVSDDENKIKSVFRALKDQIQVSQMAFQYYLGSVEKINLIDDLQSRLSKDEVGEIMAIVKKMPPYRLLEPPKKK